ncbi:hypothetical protein ABZ511_23005 [Nocardia gamkensis]|uniref:hypothetical protein n=1 Tax=Nocardia gamkensis TaxID=352869 RepID=UPI0033C6CD16
MLVEFVYGGEDSVVAPDRAWRRQRVGDSRAEFEARADLLVAETSGQQPQIEAFGGGSPHRRLRPTAPRSS